MITRSQNPLWGHKTMPPSYDECKPKPTRRRTGYTIEASSYAMFAGAIEAKRAKWLSRRLKLSKPSVELPAENIAAIKMLDRWLGKPESENDQAGDEFRELVNKHRSSNRKVYT
jgi:hypothetical protein